MEARWEPELERELSILITDDEEIRFLNENYRQKDSATDVLSFPQEEAGRDQRKPEGKVLGDVVISLETTERQASELGVSLEEEFYRLFVHGVLHLYGFEHEGVDKEARDEMFRVQDEMLALILNS